MQDGDRANIKAHTEHNVCRWAKKKYKSYRNKLSFQKIFHGLVFLFSSLKIACWYKRKCKISKSEIKTSHFKGTYFLQIIYNQALCIYTIYCYSHCKILNWSEWNRTDETASPAHSENHFISCIFFLFIHFIMLKKFKAQCAV